MTKVKVSKKITTNNSNVLSKNDIISIIKHCSEYNVHNLKIEGLELCLGDKPNSVPYSPLQAKPNPTEEEFPLPSEDIQNEMADLLVTDPMAWEELETSRKEDYAEAPNHRRS